MANKRIRVRSKRLSQVDETKLSLALWLIARGMVEDKTEPPKEKDTAARSEGK